LRTTRGRLLRGSRGYGVVETALVVILMGLLAVVVMERYQRTLYEAQKTALKAELVNIRQALALYKALNGRYPASLRELLERRALAPYEAGILLSPRYLEHQAVDEQGRLLDPFGAPYIYDPATGTVRSSRRGFEGW